MKKIMLAAVAASFMSTGAQAIQLPAEGEVCSSIHSNITSGINVVELSDYRKCVMIQHDIDTAFTYKTFWVRNGDTFTSFPVETLAKMTRGERAEHIKTIIVKETIIETIEKIVKDKEGALADLLAELNVNSIDELRGLQADISELKVMLAEAGRPDSIVTIEARDGYVTKEEFDAVDELKNRKIAHAQNLQDELNVITAERDALLIEVDDLSHRANENAKNAKGWYDEAELRQERINELTADIANKQALIDELLAAASAPAVDLEQLRGLARSNPLSDNKRDFTAEPVNANDYVTYDDTVTGPGLTTVDVTDSPFGADTMYLVKINGQVVTFAFSGDDTPVAHAIEQIVSTTYKKGYDVGFEAGYKSGYDDGYKDGYADGYADGFTDGVNSVRQ